MAQMTGASGLTAASPVTIPTRSGPKQVAEVEELLGDQRLDRGGVVGAPALGEGEEHGADRDQALARPGRRAQDDVRARGQLEQRVLLRRVERAAGARGPVGVVLEEVLRGGVRRLGLRGRTRGRRPGCGPGGTGGSDRTGSRSSSRSSNPATGVGGSGSAAMVTPPTLPRVPGMAGAGARGRTRRTGRDRPTQSPPAARDRRYTPPRGDGHLAHGHGT